MTRLGQECGALRRTLFVADVAGDLRSADHGPVVTPDGRDRQRDRHQRAVLAAADGFEMADRFSVANVPQDVVFLVLTILGNDHSDRPADRFRRTESEYLLGRAIPRGDRAIEVL